MGDIQAMEPLGSITTSIPPIPTKIKKTQFVGSVDSYLPPLKFGAVDFGPNSNLGVQMFPFKRPLTGINPINTPATIMILDHTTGKRGTINQQTNKFILQNISKPHNERVQIIETFGKSHVFFYNERTRVYSMQGVMLDAFYQTGDFASTIPTTQNQYRNMWALGFQQFYNEHLRGWKLKTQGKIAALYTNGWLIKGYPINLVISKESTTMPEAVTFQMSWVIEDEFLLNAKLAERIYNGIRFDPATVGVVNELNIKIDRYNEALARFNDATAPVEKAAYLSEYKRLEQEVVELQSKFNSTVAQLSPNKSIVDLNYE